MHAIWSLSCIFLKAQSRSLTGQRVMKSSPQGAPGYAEFASSLGMVSSARRVLPDTRPYGQRIRQQKHFLVRVLRLTLIGHNHWIIHGLSSARDTGDMLSSCEWLHLLCRSEDCAWYKLSKHTIRSHSVSKTITIGCSTAGAGNRRHARDQAGWYHANSLVALSSSVSDIRNPTAGHKSHLS